MSDLVVGWAPEPFKYHGWHWNRDDGCIADLHFGGLPLRVDVATANSLDKFLTRSLQWRLLHEENKVWV